MAVRPTQLVYNPKPGLLAETTVDPEPYNPLSQVNASGGVGGQPAVHALPAGYKNPLQASIDAGHPLIDGNTGIAPKNLSTAQKALGNSIGVSDIKGISLAPADVNTARNYEQATSRRQAALVPMLQDAAVGAVPSAAQIASRANLNQQSLAQAQAAASIRGGAPGIYAAQHAVAAGLGGIQGQSIAGGGAARAAELSKAQQILAQHLLATRTGDVGMAGTDAVIASRNADIAQNAALANQANQLKVRQANLTNAVNAGSLDLNDQTRLAILAQQGGLQNQEARDARAIGNAGLQFGDAQGDLNEVNAANADYLGGVGLGLRGAGLKAAQKEANYGLDAGYLSALLGAGSGALSLATIPSAPQQPLPSMQAVPNVQLTAPTLGSSYPQTTGTSLTPSLALQPMTSPDELRGSVGY